MTDLARIPSAVLRELAHLAEQRERRRPRFTDPHATAENLAVMLSDGRQPALGWWLQQIAPHPPSDAPVCPPAAPWTPYTDTELMLSGEELATMPIRPDAATGALADIAARSGLPPDSLRRATDLYAELENARHTR